MVYFVNIAKRFWSFLISSFLPPADNICDSEYRWQMMVAAFKIQWDETEDRLLSLVNAPKHRSSPWKLSSEYLEISIITKLYQTLSTRAKALVCTCAPLKPSQHRLTGSNVNSVITTGCLLHPSVFRQRNLSPLSEAVGVRPLPVQESCTNTFVFVVRCGMWSWWTIVGKWNAVLAACVWSPCVSEGANAACESKGEKKTKTRWVSESSCHV